MKVTLNTYGGLTGGVGTPPVVVDLEGLDANEQTELRSLVAAATAERERALPATPRAQPAPDAQGYEIAWAIARESRQRELRPEVVVALISVESGYRPGVVSPTNDHGLMQLHGDRVYDIERNIALGCIELATWRATYQCAEREMLAHYNGGCRPPVVSWGYADRVLALAEEVTE